MRFVLALEPFLAGINLSAIDDTENAPEAASHDTLRNLPPSDIETRFRAAWPTLSAGFMLSVNDKPLALEITSVLVPEVGNIDLPRDSFLTLRAVNSEMLPTSFTWGETFGLLALRVDGGDEPFEILLNGGDTVEFIKPSALQIFTNYIKIGFEHIVPKGLDHILFVLGLFFFSTAFRPLLWQVTTFTAAHTLTLALAMTGVIALPASIVEPLIALSIAYVACDNLISRQARNAWPEAFLFGLLHGLGFASVLGDFGLPPDQLVSALLGFNVGVELGQLTVIAGAYATLGYWFGSYPKYRGRVAIPASLTIALIGGYWFAERVFL